ncbi:MAG: ferrochelatase [Acidimicrobiales bacterium]
MIGVLLMAHGTPSRMQDIPSFLESIRSHRPSQAELDELARRYRAIGGLSPLAQLTVAHSNNLMRILNERDPGRFSVAVGMKHAKPSLEDSLDVLERAGATSIIGVALAPHFSRASIGDYENRVRSAMHAKPGFFPPTAFHMVRSWHLAPGLIELWAERVGDAIARLEARLVEQEKTDPDPDILASAGPASNGSAVHVIFTAHSLPARLIDQGDPYAEQASQTAAAIAAQAMLQSWSVAWQSAAMHTTEPWLEPDIKDAIGTMADAGCRAVAVCPIGFVSDHLETLYDLDISAREAATADGVAFERCASLDRDIRLAEVLANIVYEKLEMQA